MRADMAKLLVERPRKYSRTGRHLRRRHRRVLQRQDLEAAPKVDSMAPERQFGWHRRRLNENLNPLLRLRERNVGRPWSKVHSEIRAHVRVDSAVQLHILQHLDEAVRTDLVMGPEGPALPDLRERGGFIPYLAHGRDRRFYVHPVSGLLCKASRVAWSYKDEQQILALPKTSPVSCAVAFKIIDDFYVSRSPIYVRVADSWFETIHAPLPDDMTWARYAIWCRLHPAEAPFDPLLGISLGDVAATTIRALYDDHCKQRCIAIGRRVGHERQRILGLR